VYKALTAAKLAERLSESGIRAVPVFWLATEDHDVAEVDHVWVFDAHQRPVKLQAATEAEPGQPAGSVVIRESPVDALRRAFEGMLHGDEVCDLVADAYQPGRTLGEAFHHLLRSLLAGHGIVFLDPLEPSLRSLAEPFLRAAWAQRDQISRALLERNRELAAAGYHAQVLFDEGSTAFFELANGRRRKLAAGEEPQSPELLSPSALLRPVLQDYLLPSAAYIGGPAEIAYLAQSNAIYRILLGRMPLALPRASFTLLDERSRMVMERFHVTLSDCYHGAEPLTEKIARRLVPETLQITFEDSTAQVRSAVDRLVGDLRTFDPTLSAAMEKSRAKILYQIEKNRRKAAREALRRDDQVRGNAAHLADLVFPERHLQERLYSFLPFLARHGFGLLETIYENASGLKADHLLLTI
jgi:uncharacterized protein YllA (UPF0747 family)